MLRIPTKVSLNFRSAATWNLFVAGILAILLTAALLAQQAWTAAEDHQNMMAQLGIRKLRPGPSGNESAPNHANYDEATANPFPNLPEVLTLKNRMKVTSADMWWNQRRPEILEDFDREVLGRVPKNVPKVTWTVTQTVQGKVNPASPTIGVPFAHGRGAPRVAWIIWKRTKPSMPST